MKQLFLFLLITTSFALCTPIDNSSIVTTLPQHNWERKDTLRLPIQLKDSGDYTMYLIVRHTQRFRYNNLIVTFSLADAKNKTSPLRLDLKLADEKGNWLGNNMDDTYEHRIKLDKTMTFSKGTANFILWHNMLDDPLEELLNIGVDLKK